MSDSLNGIRFFVHGEGVRDNQWDRLSANTPTTVYYPPSFTHLTIPPTPLSHLSTTVHIYPADAEVVHAPFSNPARDSTAQDVSPSSAAPTASEPNTNSLSMALPSKVSVLNAASEVDSRQLTLSPAAPVGSAPLHHKKSVSVQLPPKHVPHHVSRNPQPLETKSPNIHAHSKVEPVTVTLASDVSPVPPPRPRKLSGFGKLIATPFSNPTSQGLVVVPSSSTAGRHVPTTTDATSKSGQSIQSSVPGSLVADESHLRLSSSNPLHPVADSILLPTKPLESPRPQEVVPQSTSTSLGHAGKEVERHSSKVANTSDRTKQASMAPHSGKTVPHSGVSSDVPPASIDKSVGASATVDATATRPSSRISNQRSQRPGEKKLSTTDRLSLESQREAMANILAGRRKGDKRRSKHNSVLPELKPGPSVVKKPDDPRLAQGGSESVKNQTGSLSPEFPPNLPIVQSLGKQHTTGILLDTKIPPLTAGEVSKSASSDGGKIQNPAQETQRVLSDVSKANIDVGQSTAPDPMASKDGVTLNVSGPIKSVSMDVDQPSGSQRGERMIADLDISPAHLESERRAPTASKEATDVTPPAIKAVGDKSVLLNKKVPNSAPETKASGPNEALTSAFEGGNDRNDPRFTQNEAVQSKTDQDNSQQVLKSDLLSNESQKSSGNRVFDVVSPLPSDGSPRKEPSYVRKPGMKNDRNEDVVTKGAEHSDQRRRELSISHDLSPNVAFQEPHHMVAVFKRLVKTIVHYNQKHNLFRDDQFEQNRRTFLREVLKNISGRKGSAAIKLPTLNLKQDLQKPQALSSKNLIDKKKASATAGISREPDGDNNAKHVSGFTQMARVPERKSRGANESVAHLEKRDSSRLEFATLRGSSAANASQLERDIKILRGLSAKFHKWTVKIDDGRKHNEDIREDICETMQQVYEIFSSAKHQEILFSDVTNQQLQDWLLELESGSTAISFLWSSVSNSILALRGIAPKKEALRERTHKQMTAVVQIVGWCCIVLKWCDKRCEDMLLEEAKNRSAILEFSKYASKFLDRGGKEGDRPEMFLLGRLRQILRSLPQTRSADPRSNLNNTVDQLEDGIKKLLNLVSSLSHMVAQLHERRARFPSEVSNAERIRDRAGSRGRSYGGYEGRRGRGSDIPDSKANGSKRRADKTTGVDQGARSRNWHRKGLDTGDSRASSTESGRVVGTKRKLPEGTDEWSERHHLAKRRASEPAGSRENNNGSDESAGSSGRKVVDVNGSSKGGTSKPTQGGRAAEPHVRPDRESAPVKLQVGQGADNSSRSVDRKRYLATHGDTRSKDALNAPEHSNLRPRENSSGSHVKTIGKDKVSSSFVGSGSTDGRRDARAERSSIKTNQSGTGSRMTGKNEQETPAQTVTRMLSQKVDKNSRNDTNVRRTTDNNFVGRGEGSMALPVSTPGRLASGLTTHGQSAIDVPRVPRRSPLRSILRRAPDANHRSINAGGPSGQAGAPAGRGTGRRVSFSDNLIHITAPPLCPREDIEVLFNDGFDILGDKVELQTKLVDERINCLARGSVIVLYGYLVRYVESLKRQAEGVSPIRSDRMRLPYLPSAVRLWARKFDMTFPIGRSPPTALINRPATGGLGLRSARPPMRPQPSPPGPSPD